MKDKLQLVITFVAVLQFILFIGTTFILGIPNPVVGNGSAYQSLALLLLLSVVLANLVSVDARMRKKNTNAWFVASLLLGFVGAMAYCIFSGKLKNHPNL